jgi:hypothetical protein
MKIVQQFSNVMTLAVFSPQQFSCPEMDNPLFWLTLQSLNLHTGGNCCQNKQSKRNGYRIPCLIYTLVLFDIFHMGTEIKLN